MSIREKTGKGGHFLPTVIMTYPLCPSLGDLPAPPFAYTRLKETRIEEGNDEGRVERGEDEQAG